MTLSDNDVDDVLLGSHLDLVEFELEAEQLGEHGWERRQHNNLGDVVEQRVRCQAGHTEWTLQLLTHRNTQDVGKSKSNLGVYSALVWEAPLQCVRYMLTSVSQDQQHMFGVRSLLGGQKFASNTEVQSAVSQWLGQRAASLFCIRHS